MKIKINHSLLAIALMALGLAGSWPSRVQAEPPPDFVDSILRTVQSSARAAKRDTVAMVCTKCRTVLLSGTSTREGLPGWLRTGSKHECPGCGGELITKSVPAGQGSVSLAEYVHTCSKCGDDSAFCCATKPGSGPTKGMQKKKQ